MADDGPVRIWRVVGVASVAAAWLLSIITQAVTHDFLPPEISVSQYGVGPHGWIFTCLMLDISLACTALYLARPERSTATAIWLGAGIAGTVVMAIVRTDPGGLQQSLNAKIHLSGSVLTVSALPVGICLALRTAGPTWRRWSIALTVASAFALALLLLAAVGIDSAGIGASASWAFWQAVCMVLDMLLLSCFAAGVGWREPADPDRTIGAATRGRGG